MKAKISAGAELDILSPHELKASLNDQTDKLTGGVNGKYFPYSGACSAAAPLLITAPDAGFLWSLKLVSATFDVADSLVVYVKDGQASNMIGYDDPTKIRHVYTWSSNAGIIIPTVNILVGPIGAAVKVTGMLVFEEVAVGDEWRL